MSEARQSQTIGALAAALAKAQAKMQPPKKDKTAEVRSKKGEGSSYRYHYSDLASLIDAIREPLASNGLAFVQPITRADGHMVIQTVLLHSSGEWISSDYPVSLYNAPQEQGSAITYGRRYSLGSLVGLAPEDDDGAAAQAATPQQQRQKKDKASQLDADIVETAESIVMAFGGDADELIGRASAFPKEDDDEHTAAKKLDAMRWTAERAVVLAPHNQYIKGAKKLPPPKNEKWKRGTLARLIARRDALRKEPTEAELLREASDAELFQPSDSEIPF